MSFANDADFQDDFRKVGKDATADYEVPGDVSNPTEHASSENLDVAAKAADADADDLEEDDETEDDDELEDDEDLDDDDLDEEDDDEEEDADELEDDDDLDDEDEDDDVEEDEDDEEEDDAVKARLGDAEARVRAS